MNRRIKIGLIVFLSLCAGVMGVYYRYHLLWMVEFGMAEKIEAVRVLPVNEPKENLPLEVYNCGELKVLLPQMRPVESSERGTTFDVPSLQARVFVGAERIRQPWDMIGILSELFESRTDDFSWSMTPRAVKRLYGLMRMREFMPALFGCRVSSEASRKVLLRMPHEDSLLLDIEFTDGSGGFAMLFCVEGTRIEQRHIDYLWYLGTKMATVGAADRRESSGEGEGQDETEEDFE